MGQGKTIWTPEQTRCESFRHLLQQRELAVAALGPAAKQMLHLLSALEKAQQAHGHQQHPFVKAPQALERIHHRFRGHPMPVDWMPSRSMWPQGCHSPR